MDGITVRHLMACGVHGGQVSLKSGRRRMRYTDSKTIKTNILRTCYTLQGRSLSIPFQGGISLHDAWSFGERASDALMCRLIAAWHGFRCMLSAQVDFSAAAAVGRLKDRTRSCFEGLVHKFSL